jgi:hypothetical protein
MNTMAFGLNNENQVVGSFVDASGNTHGFVYNWITQKMTQIDDPNADGTTAFPDTTPTEGTVVNGINDKGQLVGFYAEGGPPPCFCFAVKADAVSTGAVNGFLATAVVPEPSTWVMMTAGFAGLGLLGYGASRRRLRAAAQA